MTPEVINVSDVPNNVVGLHAWRVRRAEAKVEAAKAANRGEPPTLTELDAMSEVFQAHRIKLEAERRVRERVALAQSIATELKSKTYWDPTVPQPPRGR